MSFLVNSFAVAPAGPTVIANTTGTFSSPTPSIPVPGSIQAGDLAILTIGHSAGTEFSDLSAAGWTFVWSAGTGAGIQMDSVRRILTGSETNITWGTGPSGVYTLTIIRGATSASMKHYEVHSVDGTTTFTDSDGFTKDGASKFVLMHYVPLANPGTYTGPTGHTVGVSGTTGRVTYQSSSLYTNGTAISLSVTNNIHSGYLVMEVT